MVGSPYCGKSLRGTQNVGVAIVNGLNVQLARLKSVYQAAGIVKSIRRHSPSRQLVTISAWRTVSGDLRLRLPVLRRSSAIRSNTASPEAIPWRAR